MLDFRGVPDGRNCDVQAFRFSQNAVGALRWVKPRGFNMVSILLGGGGGGGGSGNDTLGTKCGGGAGGSSGALRIVVPLILLPDYLILDIGKGGAGGTSGNNDAGAGGSTILYWPSTATTLITQPGGGQGTNGGNADSSGTAGAAGAIATITGLFAQLGIAVARAGIIGGVGRTATTTNETSTGVFCQGSGGTGNATTGSVAPPAMYTYWPTIAGSASGGVAGTNGYDVYPSDIYAGTSNHAPVWFMGGTGGSGNAVTGGKGGDGNNGSGGGGGGAGSTNGGAGGTGGNGLAIFTAW